MAGEQAQRSSELEEAEKTVRDIGRLLKSKLPADWGFFLCLADFGPAGRAEGFKTYTASIVREDAIKLLREMANDLEADPRFKPETPKDPSGIPTPRRSG